jgi:uncharacterized protein YyaL (SSP411 family)
MATLGQNRLKDEKSSYLLQHKDNPIHWFAYGPEAIEKARTENKPIFMSIGYSSCHWCHVMAHESFSNNEVAEFLNENYVCIKVDREEHPDIDNYYQQACQLFVKTGGWPLSAFLLPDMRPFFVGTYYPLVKSNPEEATFLELAQELHRAFSAEKEQVETNAANVTKAIEQGPELGEKIKFPGHFPPPMAIMDAIKEFADKDNGGFGHAPKFPHFPFYEWALEQMLEGMVDKDHGEHIIKSLEKMLMGGLFDHAKGGVHRYSVDDQFTVPHFEKMLYDQAGALSVLAKLSLMYPSPLVYDTLINTLDYLASEMLDESGYFFSAQDADSEGVEGLYFTFTEEEFENIVNNASSEEDDLTARMQEIKEWFNITKEGNFERSLNVISLNASKKDDLYAPNNWDIIRRIRKEILNERKGRIPPATDSKGVSSWNSMMTTALVDVMQYCQVEVIKRKAGELFRNVVEGHYKNFMIKKDNLGMMIRHTTTREQSLPYLEDFVFFAESMLRVYEITGNQAFKKNALDTIEFIMKEFVEEDSMLTRARGTDGHELYPNQKLMPYDSSFQSVPMTMIGLVKRARLLAMDADLGMDLEAHAESMKDMILKNPINAGEGLRAYSYPDEAYRVLKVPRGWLQKAEYLNFVSFFLPRFVLDYHEEKNESWQICNLKACELQGEGIENFMETLKPKSPEEKPTEKPENQ